MRERAPVRHRIPPLVDVDRKFLLFLNAKAGNTTLKTWFFENMQILQVLKNPKRAVESFGWSFPAMLLTRPAMMARLYGNGFASDSDLRGFARLFRMYHCRAFFEAGAGDRFAKILVTRNPYDRIVSSFADKFCGEDVGKAWVKDVVRQAGTDGAISFRQFLNYLAVTDDEQRNSHWQSQSYNVKGVRFDHLIKLENLQQGFAAIGHITGTNANHLLEVRRQSNQFNAVPASAKQIDETSSNLEIAQFKLMHGFYPSKTQFLSAEIRGMIEVIFKQDFDRLGYDIQKRC